MELKPAKDLKMIAEDARKREKEALKIDLHKALEATARQGKTEFSTTYDLTIEVIKENTSILLSNGYSVYSDILSSTISWER